MARSVRANASRGVELPTFANTEASIPELKERIARRSIAKAIKPAQIDGSEDKEIVMKFAVANASSPGSTLLLNFCLPNFYFIPQPPTILLRQSVELGSNCVETHNPDFSDKINAVALITGTNSGLGFEFARQYQADGWQVFAACRNPASAGELQRLAKDSSGKLTVVAMDVTDAASIQKVATQLDDVAIDLVVNSAGITGVSGQRARQAQ